MSIARITMPAIPSMLTGIRRWLRLIAIEIRFSYAWLFMPLVVIAAIWFFNAWLWQPGRRWDVVSSNIAQSFLLIGPAGTMWSAFVAGREGRSRLSDLTSSLPVGSLSRHLIMIGTPVVGSVLAYGTGAMAMMFWYGRSITWGGPDWPLIGFGAVVVLACAMVGAAFGRVLHGRFAPVIVSGSIFLYFVMAYSIADPRTTLRGWALLAYPRDRLTWPSPLMEYPSAIGADQHSLMAGVVIALTVIVASVAVLVMSHGGISAATPFAVVAVIGFVIALQMTNISPADRTLADRAMSQGANPVENPPIVCAGEVVTTCLHQIDAIDLDEASAAADALLGPLQGLSGVPHTIEMRADLGSEPGILRESMAGYEIDAVRMSHAVIPAIFGENGEHQPLSMAEQVIAAWLMQLVHPVDDAWFFTPPDTQSAPDDPETLQVWRAEITRDAEQFGALSPDTQRSWLEANWDALRAGELTLGDLP